MRLKNIHASSDAISPMIFASQGDIGSVVALYKFMEIRNLISFANMSIENARNEIEPVKKYYYYRSAILDYNACYDYILQIVYFGFDFCCPIGSKSEYIKQMSEDCKLKTINKDTGVSEDSIFQKEINKLRRENTEADTFFKQFDAFKKDIHKKKKTIQYWANNIKHHGGFVVEELLDRNKLARIVSKSDECVAFDTEYIYPLITTFEEIDSRLAYQNDKIVKFLIDLKRTIFGEDLSTIDIGVTNKLFSANKYSKEDLSGNTYLTTSIINE